MSLLSIIFSCIFLYYGALDVDIFLLENKTFVISNFAGNKEFENIDFTIKSIFLISLFLSVYKIEFSSGESYRFRALPIKFELFNSTKFGANALKIENEFKDLLLQII